MRRPGGRGREWPQLAERHVARGDVLVANVSDGGRDCRRHDDDDRLHTRSVQRWIDDGSR
jgi:hypothetical protein